MRDQPKTEAQYYAEKDSFLRYVHNVVNPARVEVGLNPIDRTTADVCYQIIHDFFRRLDEGKA